MDRRTFLQAGVGIVGTALVAGKIAGTRQGSDTQSFEPLGSVDVPGAADAAVGEHDEFVYVAAEDGFAVVDITTPDSPEVVAERRDIETETDDPLGQVWDLWPWNDRLVVGGPAQGARSSAHGFALFDISDPRNPQQITFFDAGKPGITEGGHYIHNSYFEDGIVYLTGSGIREHPLVMIDVSDDDPEEVGRWSIIDYDPDLSEIPFQMRPIHDVYVQDDIAYLPYWDAGTWIVDVSDPADPTVLSRVGDYELEALRAFQESDAQVEAFIPPGNAHYAQVNEDGSILAVGEEAWAMEDGGELRGGPGGVKLYDVTDKTEPEFLTRIEAPESFGQTRDKWFTTAHNCDIVGDRLYTSWYYGGVKIHDVSDPENPEELAWWRNPRDASFWTAQSAGDVFVGSSANVSEKIRSDALNETAGRLYVFPAHAGEQPDPPSLTDRPADLFGEGDGDTEDSEGQESDGQESDERESDDEQDDSVGGSESGETANETTDERGEDDDSDSVDSFGPGFGVAGTIAGVGGYYLLSQRRRDDSE